MSDTDDKRMVVENLTENNDNSGDTPESRRRRLLRPVHEENFPDHVGEKENCTFDTLLQKILDDDKQYDLSKIVSAYELAEHYHHDQKRDQLRIRSSESC